MAALTSVLDRLDQDLEASLDRLFDLIAIRSISADPGFRADCRAAARWLATDLAGIGFTADIFETAGNPMVVAEHPGPDPDGPHLLFYGHYDVQPIDPVELWQWDPFSATIQEVEGRKVITGRGASDDKGQLMTFIEACRAFKAVTGGLPCRITIFLEGEEESGSPSMASFLQAHGDKLRADAVLICDTSMWNRDTPALTASLRGLVAEEVIIHGPDRDLHSGLFGGAAANPLHVLTAILADLHDGEGRVNLEGFYAGVAEIPPEILTGWHALAAADKGLLAEVGLAEPAGEVGYSVLEQTWARPTAEINGIAGGYAGEGFKTVIPAKAAAKVSFRLVGSQNPDQVRQAFRRHVQSRLPKDCRAQFQGHGGAPAIELAYDSPLLALAGAALSDEWPTPPVIIGMGGSIPVVGDFQRSLGIPPLLVGFGLPDDNVHSPNEKYDLACFHHGQRSWARILTALAQGLAINP